MCILYRHFNICQQSEQSKENSDCVFIQAYTLLIDKLSGNSDSGMVKLKTLIGFDKFILASSEA
jgi:hypothetical protein